MCYKMSNDYIKLINISITYLPFYAKTVEIDSCLGIWNMLLTGSAVWQVFKPSLSVYLKL